MFNDLSWYLHEPTPAHWKEARRDLHKVLDGLPDIAEEFGAASSDFVLEPHCKYYILTVAKQRGVLEKLLNVSAPIEPDELKDLDDVRHSYYGLIGRIGEVTERTVALYKKNHPGHIAG